MLPPLSTPQQHGNDHKRLGRLSLLGVCVSLTLSSGVAGQGMAMAVKVICKHTQLSLSVSTMQQQHRNNNIAAAWEQTQEIWTPIIAQSMCALCLQGLQAVCWQLQQRPRE